MPPLRSLLIDSASQFTRQASRLPGVIRIALIGSLPTPKPNPKDADVLVFWDLPRDYPGLSRSSGLRSYSGTDRPCG
jgi:hypothetical protein